MKCSKKIMISRKNKLALICDMYHSWKVIIPEMTAFLARDHL